MNHNTIEDFWAKVDRNGPPGIHSQTGKNIGSCWLWGGVRLKSGYGQASMVSMGARKHRAHRLAYVLTIGPVPIGLELDHVCNVRMCVRPDHLECVTHAENVRRRVPFNSKKTHCPRGHEFAGANLYIRTDGRRTCRGCANRKRNAELAASKRAAA